MADVKASPTRPLLTYRGAVYPAQCDHMGHMNVASYVAKFDEATWQLLNAIGLTPVRMRIDKLGMAGVEQHIEYKRELFPGDVVTVTSVVLEVRDKVIRFAHEMTRDDSGELAATMVVVAVHLDTSTQKARVFPDDVRERASSMVAAAGVR
jgi:acyl-CoA thioester hydrolase